MVNMTLPLDNSVHWWYHNVMKKNNNLRKMILSALFLALAYVMPFLTGQFSKSNLYGIRTCRIWRHFRITAQTASTQKALHLLLPATFHDYRKTGLGLGNADLYGHKRRHLYLCRFSCRCLYPCHSRYCGSDCVNTDFGYDS